jgi:hypothetical protein
MIFITHGYLQKFKLTVIPNFELAFIQSYTFSSNDGVIQTKLNGIVVYP